MDIQTHTKIDYSLCGIPLEIKPGYSRVSLKTTPNMAVDEKGLVHGGFLFGLADHAAMIAVNEPTVVLAAAEIKFEKPVKVGETLIGEAIRTDVQGKKQTLEVTVKRDEQQVFHGVFSCYVLAKHVLD